MQDLPFWKSCYVSWRNAAEKAQKTKSPKMRELLQYRNTAWRMVRKFESKVLVLVAIALFVGGCCTARGFGTMIKGAGTDIERLNDGYDSQR